MPNLGINTCLSIVQFLFLITQVLSLNLLYADNSST